MMTSNEQQASIAEAAPDAPKRILIVEDEAVIAMDIEQRLLDMGYDVVGIAASGERARALAQEHQPDLIMMDIMIKGSDDGIETARRILEERDVPIVFLTAYADARTLTRAKESMPYGYLMKPFRPNDLRTTIEVAMHKHAVDRRLRESEHWLTKTLQCIGDGIIATDSLGRVRFMNPMAEELLGVREQEVLGSYPTEVFPLEDEQTHAPGPDLVAQAISSLTQTPLVSGVLAPHRRRKEIYVDAGAAPIRDDDGRLLGSVLVFNDVSQRRLAEAELARHREHLEQLVRERTRELREAKDEAERASRAKTDFLSSMSHELRTPMNAILGFSEILSMEALSRENAESVQLIREAGEHLLKLIDDLLDLSRIEAGRLAVKSEPVALAEVYAQVRQLVAPLLPGNAISLHADDMGALWVLADPIRLKQALLNLVSNAIKYNRPGGAVHVTAVPDDGNRIRIEVRDTGQGISTEMQAKLFRPFERLGAEATGVQGTGLGLAFSKKLIELMNGRLGLYSVPGEGSIFWIALPRAERA